jgi:hypothetical protein
MLETRGIRKGVEVFVKDPFESSQPAKKARVVRTYPHPSSWLIVEYDDGNMEEVEEQQVTTLFEINRKKIL